MIRAILLICLVFFGISYLSEAQENDLPDTIPVVSYGDKGFVLRARDGNYLMNIQWRGQFRVAYPYDDDPVTYDDFGQEQFFIGVNRARMKVGGHAFAPWFKYYLEYELYASNLLDFRLIGFSVDD